MKFGIVGSGSIAQRYASIIEASFDAEVFVVSDFQPDAFERFSVFNREQATRFTRSNPNSLDVLVIASENRNHLSDFVNFSALSRKILIEKPLFHRPLQPNESSWFESFDGQILVSSPLRYLDAFAEMVKRIDQIGKLGHIEVRCQSWLPNWRPGRDFRTGFWNDPSQGGVLREIIHELDYLERLFGPLSVSWAESSYSDALNLKVESGVNSILQTKENVIVDLRLDFSTHASRRMLRLDGDLGSLEWNLLTGTITFTRNLIAESTEFPNDLDRNTSFKRQIDALIEPKSWEISGTTIYDAMRSLDLVEDIYGSIRTSRK